MGFDQDAEKKGKMRKMRIRVGDSGPLHKDDVSELPPADECSAAGRKNDLNYFFSPHTLRLCVLLKIRQVHKKGL
jgi:hypothetical protein